MVQQKASVLFREIYHSANHVIINQGGTSSGKTYSIMQVLYSLACATENLVITIAGQDIPNLKAGVLRDAQTIYNSWPELQMMIKSYNKTDRIYEFHNGSAKHFGTNC